MKHFNDYFSLVGVAPVRYLSIKDAMEILDSSYPTILSWIKRGKLEARQVNDLDNSPWILDPDSIEKVRLELQEKYQKKLDNLSVSALDYPPESL